MPPIHRFSFGYQTCFYLKGSQNRVKFKCNIFRTVFRLIRSSLGLVAHFHRGRRVDELLVEHDELLAPLRGHHLVADPGAPATPHNRLGSGRRNRLAQGDRVGMIYLLKR